MKQYPQSSSQGESPQKQIHGEEYQQQQQHEIMDLNVYEDDDDETLHRKLIAAKIARKRAEEDHKLLSNRIQLLKQEEQKVSLTLLSISCLSQSSIFINLSPGLEENRRDEKESERHHNPANAEPGAPAAEDGEAEAARGGGAGEAAAKPHDKRTNEGRRGGEKEKPGGKDQVPRFLREAGENGTEGLPAHPEVAGVP